MPENTWEQLEEMIKKLHKSNYHKKAYGLYKHISSYAQKNNIKVKQPEEYKKYENALAKLQFISLNHFEDWGTIENLIKNHIDRAYEIPNFDLKEKIKLNLSYIADFEERDKEKESLKNILLHCDKRLIRKMDYPNYHQNLPITVSEWIREFISNLGLGEVDTVKKMEYLSQSEKIKKLRKKDQNKIKNLLNLYEYLNLSSNSEKGVEETVLVTLEDGKDYVFDQGNLEALDQYKKRISKLVQNKSSEGTEKEKGENDINNYLKTEKIELDKSEESTEDKTSNQSGEDESQEKQTETIPQKGVEQKTDQETNTSSSSTTQKEGSKNSLADKVKQEEAQKDTQDENKEKTGQTEEAETKKLREQVKALRQESKDPSKEEEVQNKEVEASSPGGSTSDSSTNQEKEDKNSLADKVKQEEAQKDTQDENKEKTGQTEEAETKKLREQVKALRQESKNKSQDNKEGEIDAKKSSSDTSSTDKNAQEKDKKTETKEKQTKTPSPDLNMKIKALKQQAQEYKKGSLERKVVEQEIKNLENQK